MRFPKASARRSQHGRGAVDGLVGGVGLASLIPDVAPKQRHSVAGWFAEMSGRGPSVTNNTSRITPGAHSVSDQPCSPVLSGAVQLSPVIVVGHLIAAE